MAQIPRAGSYGMNSIKFLKNATNELFYLVQIKKRKC